jgi:formylmethanofuran:tetrahydromethanopterin formyltransferase
MSTKMTIEVDAKHESIVRRALAMAEEMEQLALTAPDGAVFDACEEGVIEQGRNLQAQVLGEAVSRRIEVAEKKGRRCGSVPAVAKRKIADPKNDD